MVLTVGLGPVLERLGLVLTVMLGPLLRRLVGLVLTAMLGPVLERLVGSRLNCKLGCELGSNDNQPTEIGLEEGPKLVPVGSPLE